MPFLFTDIEGSTKLLHELGPEGYAEALAEHRLVLREAFARHGGVEVDRQGDAFFVAFATVPGALQAAAEGQETLSSGPIRVRVGIHTGTPHLTEEGYVGEDVHLGARIAASAHGGQVVLSKQTQELADVELADLGEHRLKDFEPVWLYQLGQERFPPLKTISNTNLPRPASTFVGREREASEVVSLLQDGARLVTLSGPGGSGKTRLAIEAAAELVPEFRNGVFWIGLAALRDPALVSETIAQALGAKDGLVEHVGERELLLLLDNFEQVVEAAPELSALLSACSNLRLLVTSRELLRIQGEREYPVPPLASPEAVELFCARSQLQADDTIAELCTRLDNLPLAVELAAARTSVLSPQQILERLSQRLDLLRGGRDAEARQQTLRATIEWSYDLLSPEEQRLFARLAVFADGCTLEAAEEVAEAELDTLQSLVDRSLLRFGNERFWMLEMIREFAAERLEEHAEASELKSRHAKWFLAIVEAAEPELEGAGQDAWLGRLGDEHDNVRAALRWSLDRGESHLALRLAGSLSTFWWVRGHWTEGRRWLGEALSQPAAQNQALRAKALESAGHLAARQADFLRAEALAEESLALRRELRDTRGSARSLRVLGMATWQSDRKRFHALAEESARLSRDAGDLWCLSLALNNLGYLALDLGEYERATVLLEEALELARAQGDHRGEAVFLENLALATLEQGRSEEALTHFKQSLRLAQHLGYVHVLTDDLEGIAAVAAAAGGVEAAARLVGGAARLREEIGSEPEGAEERLHARTVAAIEESLDPERLAAVWSSGHTMTSDELVDYALNAID